MAPHQESFPLVAPNRKALSDLREGFSDHRVLDYFVVVVGIAAVEVETTEGVVVTVSGQIVSCITQEVSSIKTSVGIDAS
jgi:hypothetical protein